MTTAKRITAILCCFIMIITAIGVPTFAQEPSATDVPTKASPTTRRVYLHANGINPTDTIAAIEKEPGESFDLYFAVDTPNKGAYITNKEEDDVRLQNARAEAVSKAQAQISADANAAADEDSAAYPVGSAAREAFIAEYTANAEKTIGDQAVLKARRLEPQYDMNGYSVKIYFDPQYLEYSEADNTQPIVYTCPSDAFKDDTQKEEVEGEKFDVPSQVGYFPYQNGKTTKVIDGKTYNCAYATVFVSGTWLPDETNAEAWYNLCALPLKAKEGVRGGTSVFIEFEAVTTDPKVPYTTELFAKDVAGYSPTFTALPEHGGSFYIEFKEKNRPDPPQALPEERIHTEAQSIILTAEDGCKIYYTLDGSDPQVNIAGRVEYTAPFNITKSTTVRAFAQRTTGDMRTSYTATFEYKIVPQMPYLYLTNTVGASPIADNAYESDNTYKVYVSDQSTYAPIDAAMHEVYYTFSDENPDNITVGTNPQTSWVLVNNLVNEIEINESRVVRLKTVTKIAPVETSEINAYYLDIKPKKPTASPVGGFYATPQKVTLDCATEGAQIYYVVGDGDPKLGALYTSGEEIPINGNKTVRAIAKVGDKWSDVAVFHYFVEPANDYGVDAYYPSGTYEESVDVTLTPMNSENKVWYKLDDGNWQEYTDKITLEEDATIYTQVEDALGQRHDSDVFVYEVVPQPPVFSPESTQFTTAATVGVFALDRGEPSRYKLYYTLDGSDPSDENNAQRKLATLPGSAYNTTLSQPISGYTVISAVVLKDDEKYSEVVTHSYDIVTKKPVKPVPTLLPGEYTVTADGGETYVTQFAPVLADTQIYYTTDGAMPDPTNPAHLYTPNSDIAVAGNMTIKAIAVNAFSGQSDLGVFSYTVRPETPIAPPSGTIAGSTLPLLPVKTVPGSTVKYTIGDVSAEFVCPTGEFYIDSYGNAYADAACREPLWLGSAAQLTAPVILSVTATYNGVESLEGRYRYALSAADSTLAAPYADKPSGKYDEVDFDGEGNYLRVKLDSLNDGDTIEYRKDYTGEFLPYTDAVGIPLTGDTVLEIRSKKTVNGEDVYSNTATYLYEFVPLAPVISPVSGRYDESDDLDLEITLQAQAPAGASYTIWYRANGDGTDAPWFPGFSTRDIAKTMSVKAYVVNNTTGKHSADVIHYYILESDVVEGGNVSIAPPYAADPNMDEKRISAAALTEPLYAQGIRLTKDAQAPTNSVISYKYVYYDLEGNRYETDWADYVNNPIHTSANMDYIIVSARLVGTTGVITEKTFPTIDFIHLGIPTTSLEGTGATEFASGTKYTLLGPEDSKPHMYIYYTTDGRDPRTYGTLYTPGTELELTKTATVKAVYFSACGKCKDTDEATCYNGAYGEVGSYTYAVPTKEVVVSGGGSGSGGSKVVDNTRKYTVDFFGYEHPTHVGYIKGYPDGSVQPDGKITREEMAAILHRIKNKAYEEPFTVTGAVFPDVSIERWSVADVEYMANDGVIVGYPDGEFKPANKLTRAEFAAMICRFTGLVSKSTENPFPDLDAKHWAYGDIMALYEAGLMTGYEDSTFRAENQITRAEVMTVVNKLLGRNPSEPYVKALNYNPFNDLYMDKWYYVIVLEATITHNYYLDTKGLEIRWEDIR